MANITIFHGLESIARGGAPAFQGVGLHPRRRSLERDAVALQVGEIDRGSLSVRAEGRDPQAEMIEIGAAPGLQQNFADFK
jgi:hypothetical protein